MSKKVLEKPLRDHDHLSKRGVKYWFAPEWIRATSSAETSFQRIVALKDKAGEVNLHMKFKDGSLTYIQGSIQQEFKKWHTDRLIDYMLLGGDPDTILDSEND